MSDEAEVPNDEGENEEEQEGDEEVSRLLAATFVFSPRAEQLALSWRVR